MGRLAGKVAVVFGGARGIGLATVKEFLAEGATVFASDIREPAEELGCYRHSIVDATDEDAVAAFVEGVLAEAGRIDVLFNNVGSHLGKPLADTTTAEFDHIFALNVRTAFLGTAPCCRT
jgi:NAD(P)-dependent dehydrogenase (short-subunit alcohol dehydrogenase family)